MNRKSYRTHVKPTLIAVGSFVVCPLIAVLLANYTAR